MRRTTSMAGIIVEGPPRTTITKLQTPIFLEEPVVGSEVISEYECDPRLTAMVLSPRYDTSRDQHRRWFGGGDGDQVVETAEFLKTCSLCKRRLSSRRDIYIYRGDAAFCSIECREQKIKQDEMQEKLSSIASNSEEYRHHHHGPNIYSPSAIVSISDPSSNAETIAAA